MNRAEVLRHMRRALALASRGTGSTHPNPMVGAVVVLDGEVVGEGWHRKPGEPHAEILALEQAGPRARGGSLFVNLEPCSHRGRTGPCTEAIIAAGVRRVYASCRDPNPLVDGRGFDRLTGAGVEVTVGVLEREAEELNRAFLHYTRSGLPYLTLKLASTLDGRIAARDGTSRWITGEAARRAVHRLRAEADAVLTGVGTVLADDPRLTARGAVKGAQPARVVLDPSLRTPRGSRLLEGGGGTLILVIGEEVPKSRCMEYEERGARLLRLPRAGGRFSWKDLAGALTGSGILHVLAEGGGETAAWLLAEEAVNRLELFLGPLILGASGVPSVADMGIGTLGNALSVSPKRVRRMGEDVRISADVK